MHSVRILIWFIFFNCSCSFAQSQESDQRKDGSLRYAVPFLLINPDSRSGGMGEAGAAMISGSNTLSSNPAGAAFLKGNNFSFSYSPWLRSLASDINNLYFSSTFQLDSKQSIGFSVRYFSLGKIEFSDDKSHSLGNFYPSEFSLDFSYVKKFGDNFSLGLTTRYIYSNPTSADLAGASSQRTGKSISADISAYYENNLQSMTQPSKLSFGLHLSNLGPKVDYGNKAQMEFLPTNLRLAGALCTAINSESEFIIGLDINKLLIPTFDDDHDNLGEEYYRTSIATGLFKSFSDNPNGLMGELRELRFSGGVEYSFKKQFFLRTGYNYQNSTYGNKRYATFGTGFSLNSYQLDFAYIVANPTNNPLANTIRLSLSLNL